MRYPSVDEFLLCALPIALVATALYGLRMDKGWFMRRGPLDGSSAKRGETSWGYLNLAFGIISVNVLQIVVSSDALGNCRAVLAFIDLVALIYLFYFNGWSRNKVIGVIMRSLSLEEPIR